MVKPDNNPFYLVKIINDRFEAKVNKDLMDSGLTSSQMRVLVYLVENEKKSSGKITQRDLEIFLKVSHPTINGLLKRLEEKGFVSTVTVKEGRAQKYVSITQSGRDSLKIMKKSKNKDDVELKKLFTDDELKAFSDYLQRIVNYLA